MHLDELFKSDGGGKAASQAYWNALSKLRNAWRDVFNEELETNGSRAKEAFENALKQAMNRLRGDAAGNAQLRDALDVNSQEEIVEALFNNADIDDLSPNRIKQAMLEECRKRGKGRVELRSFLRSVLVSAQPAPGCR